MVEFGEIAHCSHPDESDDYVCHPWFHCEKVDNHLIISNLYSSTFSLIRYDSEDTVNGVITDVNGEQTICGLQGKSTQRLELRDKTCFTPQHLDKLVTEKYPKVVMYKLTADSADNVIFQYVVQDNQKLEVAIHPLIHSQQVENIKHDFKKKFKIIENHGDSELVGMTTDNYANFQSLLI